MFFKKCEPTNLEHISDSYSLDRKFGANSVADGYRAYDKVHKRHCALWITREPLDEAGRVAFYQHTRGLRRGGLERISRYGCDQDGVGYVALPILAVKRLDYDAPAPAVKAARFLQAILKIESLHLQKMVCGNICGDSFMLDSEEVVHFVGYAGGEFDKPFSTLQPEYQTFVLPEHLEATESTQAGDVFALAVVGLKLFGANFPEGPISAADMPDYLKSLDRSAPVWLQSVLPRVLSCSPEHRYKSAEQLLAAITVQAERQKELTAETQDTRSSSHDLRGEAEIVRALPIALVKRHARIRRLLRSPLFVMSCICVLLGAVLGASWIVVTTYSASSYDISESERARLLRNDGLDVIRGNVPDPSGRGAVSRFGGSLRALLGRDSYQPEPLPSGLTAPNTQGGASAPTGVGATATLVNPLIPVGNDQPGAAAPSSGTSHPSAGTANVELTPIPVPADTWRHQLNEAKAAGYRHAAGVLAYLVNTPNSIRPADISELLKVLEGGLSKENRRDRVVSYESIDADLAYMLAAALTLDLADADLFRELLTRGAQKQIGVARAPVTTVGTFALMAAIPSVREFFLGAVSNGDLPISNEDVWWLVETLILQRAEQLPDFVSSGRITQLQLGYRRFFLQSIAAATDMQSIPIGALLKSTKEGPDVADVQKYSQWYDAASVRVLLATLLTSTDPKVLESAFDALSNKSTGSTSVDQSLSYVSDKSDVLRVYYASFIGGVGLIDLLSPDEIRTAFSSMRNKPHTSQLCKLLLQRGSPRLVTAILDTLGDTINPALLVDLLKHPDKSVRIQIVPFVKEVSLASSWQQVIDAYLTESDPEVKARYESEIPRIRGS